MGKLISDLDKQCIIISSMSDSDDDFVPPDSSLRSQLNWYVDGVSVYLLWEN